MRCYYSKYILHFRTPGGTSRGVLKDKITYFIFLEVNGKVAIGECNLFHGLSYDDRSGYEEKLKQVCKRLPEEREGVLSALDEWPSIYFGVETLLKDLNGGCNRILYPEVISDKGFTIPTNALIWMGSHDEMMRQILDKLKAGYSSIKLKVGAIDFKAELELIRYIRREFSCDEVEIRLDANGAFPVHDALDKLNQLARYEIHYIEQPIKAGQWQEMAAIVEKAPFKVALDEDLIGLIEPSQKAALMNTVKPHMLILKPALIGGFASSDEWMKAVESQGGEWVITSALESNIGLNAIAQYAMTKHCLYPQGLGTGMLFTNNIPAPYSVDTKGLHFHPDKYWDLSQIL